MSRLILNNGAPPNTPASGKIAVFSDNNKRPRFVDDTGYIGSVVDGLSAITSAVSLTNSGTETNVISIALPTNILVASTTFRIKCFGTIQTTSSSGTLTFRPYLGANVSAETFQMASQTGASGPFGFFLEVLVTVRTTGSSGTYVSGGYGRIEFATPVILTSTTTSTATVDTTAATPTLKLTAQWATPNAANTLTVVAATIEQVV